MSKQIIVSTGVFSTLEIKLKDEVLDKLAMTPRKENPFAVIEDELNRVHRQFEKTYFEKLADKER